MSEAERDLFVRALEAVAGLTDDDLGQLFTDDVLGWSPRLGVTSLAELAELLAHRDDAFSNATLTITGFNQVGNKMIGEWYLEADHSGPLHDGDELVAEATGRRVHMAGATFAELSGNRIKAFRTYFDDVAFMEQILLTD